MSIALKAIIFDRDSSAARALASQLTLIFSFDTVDFCNSLSELLQHHINQPYDLCLISDATSLPNVSTFLSDFNKIGHPEPCVFAQIRDEVPAGFDRTSLAASGFATVISREIDGDDVKNLQPLVKKRKRREIIEEKKKTVGVAMNVLLAELDRVAADRRRGKATKLKSFSASYISQESAFDESILQEYLDSLRETTEKREAPKAVTIVVPERLLKKNLPGLSSNTYSGTSQRVWQKLLTICGVDPEGKSVARDRPSKLPPPPPAADPIPEAEETHPLVSGAGSEEALSEDELLSMLAEMENEPAPSDEAEHPTDVDEQKTAAPGTKQPR